VNAEVIKVVCVLMVIAEVVEEIEV